MRRAGGGYRGTFGFRKRIALQGGVAAAVTPVALLCATKPGNLFSTLGGLGPKGQNESTSVGSQGDCKFVIEQEAPSIGTRSVRPNEVCPFSCSFGEGTSFPKGPS